MSRYRLTSTTIRAFACHGARLVTTQWIRFMECTCGWVCITTFTNLVHKRSSHFFLGKRNSNFLNCTAQALWKARTITAVAHRLSFPDLHIVAEFGRFQQVSPPLSQNAQTQRALIARFELTQKTSSASVLQCSQIQCIACYLLATGIEKYKKSETSEAPFQCSIGTAPNASTPCNNTMKPKLRVLDKPCRTLVDPTYVIWEPLPNQ